MNQKKIRDRRMGLVCCGKETTETEGARREYGHRIIRNLADRRSRSEKMLCDVEKRMAQAIMKENREVVIRLENAPTVTLGGFDKVEGEFLKKYKFKRLLGSGAYSMVFLADTKHESKDHDPTLPPSLNIHKSLNKHNTISSPSEKALPLDHVAVKVVPRMIASEAYEKAIRREALILKKVGSHPHIIRLHDFVISERNFFICMECAPRTCIDTLVHLHLDENSEFQLSESNIASFFAQLLKALAHLHSFRVAHLDLKPDNLLVASDGTLRLCDFGLAARVPCDRAAHTLLTCAPEIFKLRKAFLATDMWASGVILFLLLTGYFPHGVQSGETMSDFREKVLDSKYSIPKIISQAHVSDSAKDLLGKLLDCNHKTRITAKQALEHKWFESPCTKPKTHADIHLKNIAKTVMIAARLSPTSKKQQQQQ